MSKNNQFNLDLPNGWADRTGHYFQGPDDSGVQHGLTLLIDDQCDTDDASEYARERIDHAVETLPNAEVLKDAARTLDDGTVVHEAICKWFPGEGKPSFQKMVYRVIDGVAYTFTCGFSKKTLKTIGVEVDRIIATLSPGDRD